MGLTKILVVASALCLTQCHKTESAQVASDSHVNGPSLTAHYQHAKKLAENWPSVVTIFEFGRLPGSPIPLYLVRIGLPSASNAPRNAIFISDVTHGNEYIGIVDHLMGFTATVAARMSNALRAEHPLETDSSGYMHFLSKGGYIYFVPMLNPTGYSSDKRTNSKDIDINRDFPLNQESQSSEARALRAAIDVRLKDDRSQLRIAVDYHCCSKDNNITMLLRPSDLQRPDAPLAPTAMKNFGMVADTARKNLGNVIFGSSQELLGAFGPNTSKDYYYYKYLKAQEDKHPVMSVTLEGIRKRNLERNPNLLREHISLWNQLAEWVSE